MCPFWMLLEVRLLEVVLTTAAIRRAKLQSNRRHRQTNTELFTGRTPFLSPNQQCQSTRGNKQLLNYVLFCASFTLHTCSHLQFRIREFTETEKWHQMNCLVDFSASEAWQQKVCCQHIRVVDYLKHDLTGLFSGISRWTIRPLPPVRSVSEALCQPVKNFAWTDGTGQFIVHIRLIWNVLSVVVCLDHVDHEHQQRKKNYISCHQMFHKSE